MPIPRYLKKYGHEVVISPKQHFSAEQKNAYFHAPKAVVICFEVSLMDHFRNMDNTKAEPFWTGELIRFGPPQDHIALIGNFGIGGPAACHILEILIAAGTRQCIVVGHAGSLQNTNSKGSIILIEKALRDEGVSYHYLEDEKFAYSSKELTSSIQQMLEEHGVEYKTGSSWTLDSMYRETLEEVKHYSKEGIDTVEMELASIFAVASFRKVHAAALLVISDNLTDETWVEHFHDKSTFDSLIQSVEIAQKVLRT